VWLAGIEVAEIILILRLAGRLSTGLAIVSREGPCAFKSRGVEDRL
jgi:hypothetical protein